MCYRVISGVVEKLEKKLREAVSTRSIDLLKAQGFTSYFTHFGDKILLSGSSFFPNEAEMPEANRRCDKVLQVIASFGQPQ